MEILYFLYDLILWFSCDDLFDKNVDTAFCTIYNSGSHSPTMLNSKTQDWFKAHLYVKLTWEMLKWKI